MNGLPSWLLLLVNAHVIISAAAQNPSPADFTEYSTAGHPKAHGISMTVQHPKEWQPTESKGAEIVQSFVRDDGRTQEGFWIYLHPMGVTMSEQEVREFFTEQTLRQMVSPGNTVMRAEAAQIAGMPAGVVEFTSTRQQAQTTRRNRQTYFHFIHGGAYIQLQCICQTTNSAITDDELKSRMEILKPVFSQIAESITFDSVARAPVPSPSSLAPSPRPEAAAPEASVAKAWEVPITISGQQFTARFQGAEPPTQEQIDYAVQMAADPARGQNSVEAIANSLPRGMALSLSFGLLSWPGELAAKVPGFENNVLLRIHADLWHFIAETFPVSVELRNTPPVLIARAVAWALPWLAILLLIRFWRRRQLSRRRATEREAETNDAVPRGVGGWLLLFCVYSCFILPWASIGRAGMMPASVLAACKAVPRTTEVAWLIAWSWAGIVSFFTFAILAVIVGIKLWRVRSGALLWLRRSWWFAWTISIIHIAVTSALAPANVPIRVPASFVFGTAIGFLLAWLYFTRSRRVRNTYGPWLTAAYSPNSFVKSVGVWLTGRLDPSPPFESAASREPGPSCEGSSDKVARPAADVEQNAPECVTEDYRERDIATLNDAEAEASKANREQEEKKGVPSIPAHLMEEWPYMSERSRQRALASMK